MKHPTRVIKRLVGHEASVQVVRFNQEGNYLLSGSDDKTVRLWNSSKGTLVKTYSSGGHNSSVLDICIRTDNAAFASCGLDRDVSLWDVPTGRIIRKFKGHASRINSVCYCMGDRKGEADCLNHLIVSGSYDTSVRIWDCRSSASYGSQAVQILPEARDSVTSVTTTDFQILTASVDGCLRIYDIRMGMLSTDSIDERHGLTSMRLTNSSTTSRVSQCVVVSTLGSEVILLEKETGQILNRFCGHISKNYKVECGSTPIDDLYIFSGSEDGSIYFWDMTDSSNFTKISSDSSSPNISSKPPLISSIDFHPADALMMASSSIDGTINIWS
eukprot:Sdes_comp17676_c1_seq1m6946